MRVALAQGGVIANIIEADSLEAAQALFPDAIAMEAGEMAIGWTNANGAWASPEETQPRAPRAILAGWFKAAISQMGKTADVAVAVSAQPEWKQILWHAATHIREDDADVVAIASMLNINLSEVFDKAEEIRATLRK